MAPVKTPRSKATAWVLGALLGAGVWPVSCASAPARRPADAAAATLAIVDVTLLPVPDGRLAEHQTVLIDGESIVRVGPAASTPLPPGASRVDGRGRFLMPGMADMHVHLPDDPAGRELARISLLQRLQGIVAALARAGGKTLVGSDTPGPYRVPGFSYLQEMRRLQEAGLSRAEILRAATQGAAEYLGASSRRGRIEPGQQADLVLLDANPLDDLAHLARPAGVVVRGRFLSREAAGILLEN